MDYDHYYGLNLDIVMRSHGDYCSKRGTKEDIVALNMRLFLMI